MCEEIISGSFKNVTHKLFAYKSYIYIYMCVCVYVCVCVCVCVSLNNLEGLIWHKRQPNQNKLLYTDLW